MHGFTKSIVPIAVNNIYKSETISETEEDIFYYEKANFHNSKQGNLMKDMPSCFDKLSANEAGFTDKDIHNIELLNQL